MEHALMCPQCNAPLAPHRFARSVECAFCGTTIQLDESSISAAIFHEAYRVWNSPGFYQLSSWVSIGDRHWALDHLIAHGEISDVYTGHRARWPTELVLFKVLRNQQDAALFDNEWHILEALHHSAARGADTFTSRLPQLIIHADSTGGSFAGQRVSVFRWESGFHYTFDEVIRVYPQGIPPQASIWVWRRILEVLSFIHASGMAHGAILPAHLLIQEGEHGVRLVGYGHAGRLNEKLVMPSQEARAFYPQSAKSWSMLTAELDLVMSARCIVALLGGHPADVSMPSTIPPKLAGFVRQVALSEPTGSGIEDAWTIREELGEISKEIFGPPQYIPVLMPPWTPGRPTSKTILI